ncbi:SDR family oxidoreductase [Streptomyces sp. Z26]|uniref:SDR family oxidoreductase n=1 Tax=Streptomyces sp. Z26 TaxID=2500177 RepID=UPI000EF15FFF|nr:SDR family oxidoreductase [Streptomyces sp. Z26]RLL65747.1 SDR family oxidoreductase [Streptomyces sp. Z26]
MRLFVTGGSGWIGSAVVPELLDAGHSVLALARSEAAAAKVAGLGAEVLRGDVQDLDVLRSGAERTDGVVHLAFRHDLAFAGDFDTAVRTDRAVIGAIGAQLAGTDRPFAVSSGLAAVHPGGLATESDRPEPFPGAGGRFANERAALALADRGVRAMCVRFAPTVHGAGDGGFVARLVEAARAHGVSAYPGEGAARWPAVHVGDAARAVRLAVEHAPAGSVLHAAAEEGVRVRALAEAIAGRLGVEARSLDTAEAEARFGVLGTFLGLDSPASSAVTRELLGWEPSGPTLLQDVEAGAYTD